MWGLCDQQDLPQYAVLRSLLQRLMSQPYDYRLMREAEKVLLPGCLLLRWYLCQGLCHSLHKSTCGLLMSNWHSRFRRCGRLCCWAANDQPLITPPANSSNSSPSAIRVLGYYLILHHALLGMRLLSIYLKSILFHYPQMV